MIFFAACVLANWMIVGPSSDKIVVDSFIRDGVKPNDFVKLTENARKGKTHLAATGSGFFITDDGFILTNHHVIENSAEVVVVCGDVAYRAIVVAKSKKHDLALMKINLFPRMTNGVYNRGFVHKCGSLKA
jgi:S1-C subfamily serine protease